MISAKRQRLKYILTDWVTANIAFTLFNVVRFIVLRKGDTFESFWRFVTVEKLEWEQLVIPLAMLGVYWLSGYYNNPFEKSRVQEFITTLLSSVFNTLFIYLALLTNDQVEFAYTNYMLLLLIFTTLFLLTYSARLFITSRAIRNFRKQSWHYPTLIIGTRDSAERTAEKLNRSHATIRYEIAGYVRPPWESADSETDNDDRLPQIAFSDIKEACVRLNIKQVILAFDEQQVERDLGLLYKLFDLNIPVKIEPDTLAYVTSGIHLQDIFGEPYVDLTSPHISESSKNIKRLIDVIASIVALTILSVPMAIIAVFVKRGSPGPVIFSQERIGYSRRPFNIYKFRSMRVDAELTGPMLSSHDDTRVTKIGKVLRKYRLDELPQFWNVLKGDMSLVGPRPERAYFIEKIVQQAPYYTLIHQVRPGITSWGVVKYGYASTVEQMVRRTRYDLIYLANMSTAVDLKILIYTIKTVFTGRGV